MGGGAWGCSTRGMGCSQLMKVLRNGWVLLVWRGEKWLFPGCGGVGGFGVFGGGADAVAF